MNSRYSERPFTQKIRWRATEEDTYADLWTPHVHTHTHTHVRARAHMFKKVLGYVTLILVLERQRQRLSGAHCTVS